MSRAISWMCLRHRFSVRARDRTIVGTIALLTVLLTPSYAQHGPVPPEYMHGNKRLPAVDVSAARSADGKLVLALVNINPSTVADVITNLPGAARGTILTGPVMDTHNTFDEPEKVWPAPFSSNNRTGVLAFRLPAKSVAVVMVE